ncbi:MAG: HD domain-containing protein [Bacteroidia bacterium]
MEIQTTYQKTILFAAFKHSEKNQTIPGTNLPYVVHLSNVAMEIMTAYQHAADFELDFALKLALLHDTLEDTSATFDEISTTFGVAVANGVSALTKNETLPKSERMFDSLNRIKTLPKEVWAVKLADRITNLQEPPSHWDAQKKEQYKQEAIQILQQLKGGNNYLEERLNGKIVDYQNYIDAN